MLSFSHRQTPPLIHGAATGMKHCFANRADRINCSAKPLPGCRTSVHSLCSDHSSASRLGVSLRKPQNLKKPRNKQPPPPTETTQIRAQAAQQTLPDSKLLGAFARAGCSLRAVVLISRTSLCRATTIRSLAASAEVFVRITFVVLSSLDQEPECREPPTGRCRVDS